MAKMIGVDLGTTNSVVAIVDGPRPKVLDSREGHPQVRSVVGQKTRKRGKKGRAEGEAETPEDLVGDVAVDNWLMAPRDTILSIKRLMGRAVSDPEVQRIRASTLYEIVEPSDGTTDSLRVVMGGKQYSPIDISAMILGKLKADAAYRLGEEPTHAVITVPAYFNQRQKSATRKAGLKAGLKVIMILDEPTAAAIAFGMEETESSEPKYILVYDLGGGTFDISVLMWAGSVFAPLNLEGDMWLGGDNFDQVLVDHTVAYVKEEYDIDPTDNMRFMVALKKAAKDTKERLSSARNADLIVPGILHDEDGDPIDVELEITRTEYERMIRPLVDRTVSLVEKALRNADLAADQINHVLMAGNATCVPLVQQAMEELFGKDKVLRKVHPKHSVALGAAIVAARIGEHTVCQAEDPADPRRECGHVNPSGATECQKCGAALTLAADEAEEGKEEAAKPFGGLVIGKPSPYHYGVQSAGDAFHVFIEKNEQYPTENPKTQTFYTSTANQRMIEVPVYGGDHLEQASLNEWQGVAFAILPPGLSKGTAVRIKVWLDGDGVFGLSAHLEDGTDLNPWVLEGEEDQKAVVAMQHVEATLAKKATSVSAEEMAGLEQARQRAFDALRRRDFQAAQQQAEAFQQQAAESEEDDEGDALRTKAENLIGFTQFVLHEYGWAMDAEKVYQLNNLVEATRKALAGTDRATLQQQVEELDRETDSLPDVVRVLLSVRGAILGRIRPADPAKADALMGEFQEIEQGLKQQEASAVEGLKALSVKVFRTVEELSGAKPAQRTTCPGCGKPVAQGIRECPHCGYNFWKLDTDKTAPGGGSSSSVISH